MLTSKPTNPSRSSLYFNPAASAWTSETFPALLHQTISKFHNTLPGFKPTRLTRLDSVAKELGVNVVYVKDESDRCTLPAFKILGVSWAAFQAIAELTSLSLDVDLGEISQAAKAKGITLLAATEGNHGRAIARLAKILNIPAEIFVPSHLDIATIERIRGEGAQVVIADGDYDQALLAATEAAVADHTKLHIQDTTFPGYSKITQWVVDGYSTLLYEIDEQLEGNHPDLIVAPAGCGSFAQAVVRHSKQPGHGTRVFTVETDGAPCIWRSLRSGSLQTTDTNDTIMYGMNCGEVSQIAWPILKEGVDASALITDLESHTAVKTLHALGVRAGPCGGATLAALQQLSSEEKEQLKLTQDSVVVIICTEGQRDYHIPVSA
ncbi:hypothetical protein PVAG01_04190 [Phlyctema vagabunda]|uniref:Tryptophan synthase beta chain-like PALP domain-containing protein n=1 Tax=Phlyctema vagabunda TaxID=108571 RepID=A0ABR4PNL0_9HELO